MTRLPFLLQPSIASLCLGVVLSGCGPKPTLSVEEPPTVSPKMDPLAIVLTPHAGDSETDRTIRRYQDQVRDGLQLDPSLELLGWAYVAKARESFDPGYYTLAGNCAAALANRNPDSNEARLLRGHIAQNLHHFEEAESLARELVASRGNPFDYALLGDALMERGDLDAALDAYQSALDLKPGLQTYSRAAYLRWVIGDTSGALELMRLAFSSSSARDPESLAWTASRLAALDFQIGATDDAEQSLESALTAIPDYAPALLLRGRMLLADDQPEEAVESLRSAVRANPLPDPQWALADALRAADRSDEAAEIEATIRESGERTDPRTLALFLATRGEEVARAVRLSGNELKNRQDIFSHDAFAWALTAAGRATAALPHLDKALAEGTEDGRLYFHAAVINQRAGRIAEARDWATGAAVLRHTLLPSEREQLDQLEQTLATSLPSPESSAGGQPKRSETIKTKS